MRSKISALMDGELAPHEESAPLSSLRSGGEAQEAWSTYHLIGDAMRDTRPLSAGFAERVAARLAQEPTVLAPRASPGRERWLALSAAASVAAAAFVAWVGFGPPSAPVPVAKAPAQVRVPATEETARVPLPEATRDYLLAHQGYSARHSLQGLAPYVRTVSGEAAPRKR